MRAADRERRLVTLVVIHQGHPPPLPPVNKPAMIIGGDEYGGGGGGTQILGKRRRTGRPRTGPVPGRSPLNRTPTTSTTAPRRRIPRTGYNMILCALYL